MSNMIWNRGGNPAVMEAQARKERSIAVMAALLMVLVFFAGTVLASWLDVVWNISEFRVQLLSGWIFCFALWSAIISKVRRS